MMYADVSDEGTPESPTLPTDIMALSEGFPVPWPVDKMMLKRIRDMLPPRSEAENLCEQSRRNALWQ